MNALRRSTASIQAKLFAWHCICNYEVCQSWTNFLTVYLFAFELENGVTETLFSLMADFYLFMLYKTFAYKDLFNIALKIMWLPMQIWASNGNETLFILIYARVRHIMPAHARTCCEDFCGCRRRAGEMASEIPEIFHVFGPQLNVFTSVGILLKYFRRKLLQFGWSKTVSNLGMFRFKLRCISLTKLCSDGCFFYMSCTLLHFKFHICWRLTAFPLHSEKLAGYIQI